MITALNYGQLHRLILALGYSHEMSMSQFNDAIQIVQYFKRGVGPLILIPKLPDDTPVSPMHLATINLALDKHGVSEARLNRCLGQVMRPNHPGSPRPEFNIVIAQRITTQGSESEWTWTMYTGNKTPLCRAEYSWGKPTTAQFHARKFRKMMGLSDVICPINLSSKAQEDNACLLSNTKTSTPDLEVTPK